MKRIYTALSVFFLLFTLLVGLISTFDKDATFSESERRQLKTKPKMTISGLIDGTYFNEYREYYADTFPNRETLMDTNTTLNGFYYFGGLGSGDGASLVVDFSSNAAQHGEALKPTGDPDATGETQTETEPVNKPTEPLAAAEQLGSVVLIGNSAFDVSYADNDQIIEYAHAVTAIADTLGSNVKTFSMPVPNSAEFYTHKEYHTGKTSQKDMFALCKSNLGANVTFVDAYSAIEKHTSEYIYFRTDHHWTALGAYYVYEAICEQLDLEPASLEEDFELWDQGAFRGSLYYKAPKTKALKDDNVYAYNPIGNFNTRIYREGSSGFEWTVLTDMSKSKINSKYSTFLSGDAPLVRIINNDLPDAGNVLIIKDSFGNAMAPFFTQNYHTVYVVDYRYYPKSLSNLVGSLGINDIIFLPNISDLQTRAVGDLLQKYKK